MTYILVLVKNLEEKKRYINKFRSMFGIKCSIVDYDLFTTNIRIKNFIIQVAMISKKTNNVSKHVNKPKYYFKDNNLEVSSDLEFIIKDANKMEIGEIGKLIFEDPAIHFVVN